MTPPQIEPSQFLNWLADRLITKHGEDPNADFVLKLREMATDMEATEPSTPVNVTGVPPKMS